MATTQETRAWSARWDLPRAEHTRPRLMRLITPIRTVVHASVTVRPSRIHGSGLFARSLIRVGSLVVSLGGEQYTVEEVRAGAARAESLSGLSEGVYLGLPASAPKGLDEFINHSCDPNLWIDEDVKLVARYPIRRGDELTVDYSTWEIDDTWSLVPPCSCGTPECRGAVTGRDFARDDLKLRYRGHLLSPLVDRLAG